jgi:hypothetical protein
MHNLKCDINELFIEQFIDSELDFDESAKISAHIDVCDSCKTIYEELKFIRKTIRGVKVNETLSPIEKEGFTHLITTLGTKKTFLTKLEKIVSSFNHKLIILTASTSFIILSVVFTFMMMNLDKSKSLIIHEIISAHANNLPYEFSVTNENDPATALSSNSQLKMDRKILKDLMRISPVLKGRYTSIAAQPMAKIKLKDKNGEGTLFMSKKNEKLKQVFQDGDCLVKHLDGKSCKATSHHTDGNDIVYWESRDNGFVFVSDNHQLHSSMIDLINNY